MSSELSTAMCSSGCNSGHVQVTTSSSQASQVRLTSAQSVLRLLPSFSLDMYRVIMFVCCKTKCLTYVESSSRTVTDLVRIGQV